MSRGKAQATAGKAPAAASLRRTNRDPRWLPYALVAPAVIYLLGITFYPFIYAAKQSLYRSSFVSPDLSTYVGLENYAELFTNAAFWQSIANTFIISGSAVIIEFILALTLAALVYRDPWVKGWRLIFLTPMLFMPSAVAFLWKLLFVPRASVINDLLARTGFCHTH